MRIVGMETQKKLFNEHFVSDIDPGVYPISHTETKQCRRPDTTEQSWYLDNSDQDLLKKRYVGWVNHDVSIAFKNKETGEIFFRTARKRGNRSYANHTLGKFETYASTLPMTRLFDPNKKHSVQSTSLLEMTLTVDASKYTKCEAWSMMYSELNSFTARFSQMFKTSICKIRITESTEKGYPHIHLVALSLNKDFTVQWHTNIKHNKGRSSWRMSSYKQKQAIDRLWVPGTIDIVPISLVLPYGTDYYDDENNAKSNCDTVLDLDYLLKYLIKDVTTCDPGSKAIQTLCNAWIMRMRNYHISPQLTAKLKSVSQLKQPDLILNHTNKSKLDSKYALAGIFPSCRKRCGELNGGKPPPSCQHWQENKDNDSGYCKYSVSYNNLLDIMDQHHPSQRKILTLNHTVSYETDIASMNRIIEEKKT